MESNPIPQRQRNRRSERQAESAPQPVYPQAQPVQQMPPQPVYPQQIAQPVRPAPTGYPQQANQPVRPSANSYPQMQGMQRPMQQAYPPYQPQAQAAPRPRVMGQTAASGWQQPQARGEAPHARATRQLERDVARTDSLARREDKQTGAKPAKKKLPVWLTGATTACFLVLLGLLATYWLMQAYLTTEEAKRAAAHQAILSNHHVTEQADGTLRVTWQNEIERYAAQYNLQPAFVTAIIRNESSFRTEAESSVGARGLMQLMPDTAQWIAGKLGDRTYSFDRMYDAETNIRYGCWYLGYLSRLFHGDAELVSGAYHAGQTTITSWLSDRTKSSDGVSLDLDKLPDGPTKQYIGRVTQSYGIYQSLLYPDEAFDAAVSVSAGSGAAAAGAR